MTRAELLRALRAAVTLKVVLVTNDVRHFAPVPGLSVEDWA